MEVALAAVKLAHEASGGAADDEEEIPEVAAAPGAGARRDRRRRGAGAPGRRGRRRGPTASRACSSAPGRSAGIRPQDLVGAIAGESSLTGRDIGAIEIADRFSLVEVPEPAADEVIAALRSTISRAARRRSAATRRPDLPQERCACATLGRRGRAVAHPALEEPCPAPPSAPSSCSPWPPARPGSHLWRPPRPRPLPRLPPLPPPLPRRPSPRSPRRSEPEDRYALAGGCYAVQAARRPAAGVVARRDGFTATAPTAAGAEPFHLQATDLGRYLLFGTAQDFLAADGARRRRRHRRPEPSPAADFVVDGAAAGLHAGAPGRRAALAVDAGRRAERSADAAAGSPSRLRSGCAAWPEVQTNVTGDRLGQRHAVRRRRSGYLDAHLHTMAFEFVGGQRALRPAVAPVRRRARARRLPRPRGAAAAARCSSTCCPAPTRSPGHDTVGWPTFGYWPKYDSLTHEQIYYKWLERTWRGGLRLMTTLLVENGRSATSYPLKQNSCNEMDARPPAGPAHARARALHRRAVAAARARAGCDRHRPVPGASRS